MRTDCIEYIISRNGKFIFRTETEVYPECDTRSLYKLLSEKFTSAEGYRISVTRWECRGHIIEE